MLVVQHDDAELLKFLYPAAGVVVVFMVSRNPEDAVFGPQVGKGRQFAPQGVRQTVDHVAGDGHGVRRERVGSPHHFGKPCLFLHRADVQVAELRQRKTFKLCWKFGDGHVHGAHVGHAHGLPGAPCAAGERHEHEKAAAPSRREGQTPRDTEEATDAQHKSCRVLGERQHKEHQQRGVQRFRRQHDGRGQVGPEKASAHYLIEDVFEGGGHERDAKQGLGGQSRLQRKDKTQKNIDRHGDGRKKQAHGCDGMRGGPWAGRRCCGNRGDLPDLLINSGWIVAKSQEGRAVRRSGRLTDGRAAGSGGRSSPSCFRKAHGFLSEARPGMLCFPVMGGERIKEGEDGARDQKFLIRAKDDLERYTGYSKTNEKSLYAAFSNNLTSYLYASLLPQIKEKLEGANLTQKDVPDITSSTLDFLLERHKCICDTKLEENSPQWNALIELKNYVPPEYIGNAISRFRGNVESNEDALRKVDLYNIYLEFLENRQKYNAEIDKANNDIKKLSDKLKTYKSTEEYQKRKERAENQISEKKRNIYKWQRERENFARDKKAKEAEFDRLVEQDRVNDIIKRRYNYLGNMLKNYQSYNMNNKQAESTIKKTFHEEKK